MYMYGSTVNDGGTGPSKEEMEERARVAREAQAAAEAEAIKNRPRYLDRMGNPIAGMNPGLDATNPAVMLGLSVNPNKGNTTGKKYRDPRSVVNSTIMTEALSSLGSAPPIQGGKTILGS